MSSGFQVSGLNGVMGHTEGVKTRPVPLGESDITDVLSKFGGAPVQTVIDPGHYIPFPTSGVVEWRERLTAKYRDQLQEELWWDESSSFLASEDFAGSANRNFLYVAAHVASHGDAAARSLIDLPEPKDMTAWSVIESAGKRGFGGRFPQLLLDVRYWLPFSRNMILEEPDPRGRPARFGSLASLAQELDDIRQVIAKADGRATAWTSRQETQHNNVLAAAWQGSDVMQRLCSVALARGLPMFIVG